MCPENHGNTMNRPLLSVENLTVQFRTDDGIVRAVDDVSFSVAKGETLGIVGESGSGKSVTNLAIMGLVPQPPGRVVAGRALFADEDLLSMPDARLRQIRGNRVAMIFQDPMTSLNPFLSIAEQLTEVTRLHLKHTPKQALEHAITMLERVGIPSASRRVFDYPHQFSGGMRQRVMVAMALSCKPDLLIADEPTTALDVTIQAQILELIRELQDTEGTAVILITHDLGIVAGTCHRVNVMYAGKFVEEAKVDNLFQRPLHPYTLGLLSCVPRLDNAMGGRLQPITGQPPDLTDLPVGCTFRPRCPFSIERCAVEYPPLCTAPSRTRYACFVNVEEVAVAAAKGGTRG
jgi:oligopeptide transport system ATP-binding protein